LAHIHPESESDSFCDIRKGFFAGPIGSIIKPTATLEIDEILHFWAPFRAVVGSSPLIQAITDRLFGH
jgi:hypothetical protein